MALGDLSEFHAWIERDAPSRTARNVARTFIAELGDRPWLAPSVPIAELSNQPEYEIRTAHLEVAGESDVVIWWLHVYATGDVDLIALYESVVRSRRPALAGAGHFCRLTALYPAICAP